MTPSSHTGTSSSLFAWRPLSKKVGGEWGSVQVSQQMVRAAQQVPRLHDQTPNARGHSSPSQWSWLHNVSQDNLESITLWFSSHELLENASRSSTVGVNRAAVLPGSLMSNVGWRQKGELLIMRSSSPLSQVHHGCITIYIYKTTQWNCS